MQNQYVPERTMSDRPKFPALMTRADSKKPLENRSSDAKSGPVASPDSTVKPASGKNAETSAAAKSDAKPVSKRLRRLSPTLSITSLNGEEVDPLDFEYDDVIHQAFKSNKRYTVGRMIGYGGMGIVFEARDNDFNRDVALKVLLQAHRESEDAKQRFFREAQTTAQLQHPGVCAIYDLDVCPDGQPFFSMKLVEGDTLSHILETENDTILQRSRLLNVFARVCQTIAFSHSRGIIHLDIKPSNIMVGAYGEVYVMDWGLSRHLIGPNGGVRRDDESDANGRSQPEVSFVGFAEKEPSLTHLVNTRITGTPSYMAPEQATGRSVGVRSDVFGLGAVLCEILTGKPPYEGKTARKIFRRAARGSLRRTFQRLDSCDADPALIALTKKCLSPNASKRPADAGEVASEMTAFVESSLKRAERDLCRFFEISKDLFCIASLDGYFKRVNSNFSRVLGYSDAELVSKPFINFIHPGDLADTLEAVEKLAEGNPIAEFRNRYRDAQGHYRWFEWTAKSIPDDHIIFAVARVVDE